MPRMTFCLPCLHLDGCAAQLIRAGSGSKGPTSNGLAQKGLMCSTEAELGTTGSTGKGCTCCQRCSSTSNGNHSEAVPERAAPLSPALPSLQLLPVLGTAAGHHEGLCFLLARPEWLCIGLESLHGSLSKRLPVPALTHCQVSVPLSQHSTAQHSTAQHSTAQHSTAQHSLRNPQWGWFIVMTMKRE